MVKNNRPNKLGAVRRCRPTGVVSSKAEGSALPLGSAVQVAVASRDAVGRRLAEGIGTEAVWSTVVV